MATLRHKWKSPPNPGDKVRRLNVHKYPGMVQGNIYTVRKATAASIYLEGEVGSYATNFFEPIDIPVSQVVKTENYAIY